MKTYLSKIKPFIPISSIDKKKKIHFIIREDIYALHILFDIVENKDENIENFLFKNFFLSLKSYIINEDILINNIFVVFYNSIGEWEELKQPRELKHISLFQIRKWNFYQFEDWFITRYNKDWEYIKYSKYYGIKIWFNKNDKYWLEKKIYPIYPWEINFEKIFYGNIVEKEQFLIKKEEELIEKEKILIKKEKEIIEKEKKLSVIEKVQSK